MKKLGMLGIIGGAAILTAVPLSLQWSQKNVTLSLASYWLPYGTSSSAPYGIYASSYAIACERLKSGYAAPYGPIFY